MDFKGIWVINYIASYIKVYSNQESCVAKASISIPALSIKPETKDHMMRKQNAHNHIAIATVYYLLFVMKTFMYFADYFATVECFCQIFALKYHESL